MSAMTIFYQKCPVCGRNLRVAVKYFGRPMSCTHCEGEFIAGKQEVSAAANEEEKAADGLSDFLSPSTFGQPQLGEV